MKNTKDASAAKNGVGFIELLQLVFITLKLTGHITWSWWWVLSPTWISLIIACAILVILVVVAIVQAHMARKKHEKTGKRIDKERV